MEHALWLDEANRLKKIISRLPGLRHLFKQHQPNHLTVSAVSAFFAGLRTTTLQKLVATNFLLIIVRRYPFVKHFVILFSHVLLGFSRELSPLSALLSQKT